MALVLALMTLLILSVVVLTFSLLSTTEPAIAANQVRAGLARSLAEAGIERALWALNHPDAPEGLPDPMPGPPDGAPAPYGGQDPVPLSVDGRPAGIFRVTVEAGTPRSERHVAAVGVVPSDDPADPRVKARQRITATLARVPWLDPPCAVCIRGDLALGGAIVVDGRSASGCEGRAGVIASGAVARQGGAVQVFGDDGNDIPNEPADLREGHAAPELDPLAFTPAELDDLRRIARDAGTYYRGSATFDATRPLPDGLLFFDTADGTDLALATPANRVPQISIEAGAFPAAPDAAGAGRFTGWIVANGSLSIRGHVLITGMVHAAGGLAFLATGEIAGTVVALDVAGVGSAIDPGLQGARIRWDCQAARTGGGQISQQWFMRVGSYRQRTDN